MGNYFKGQAYQEHYEKEFSDFTPKDWIAVSIFGLLIVLTAVFGFMKNWGVMVCIIGLISSSFYFLLRVIFGVRNKVCMVFVAIGILTIGAGIIVAFDAKYIFTCYVIGLYLLVCFGVGIFCLKVTFDTKKKLKEYSLEVEADCEMVDEKKINLFRFDDLVENPYNAPINSNDLVKPGFHYEVNGQEYFTESEVYYGKGNYGFKEGAKIKLKVNSDNPTEICPMNVSTGVFTVMGVGWLIAGIIVIVALIVMILTGEWDYITSSIR